MRNLTTTVLRNLGMLITDIGWKFVEFGDNLQIDNHLTAKCLVSSQADIDKLGHILDGLEKFESTKNPGNDKEAQEYDDDGNYLDD